MRNDQFVFSLLPDPGAATRVTSLLDIGLPNTPLLKKHVQTQSVSTVMHSFNPTLIGNGGFFPGSRFAFTIPFAFSRSCRSQAFPRMVAGLTQAIHGPSVFLGWNFSKPFLSSVLQSNLYLLSSVVVVFSIFSVCWYFRSPPFSSFPAPCGFHYLLFFVPLL